MSPSKYIYWHRIEILLVCRRLKDVYVFDVGCNDRKIRSHENFLPYARFMILIRWAITGVRFETINVNFHGLSFNGRDAYPATYLQIPKRSERVTPRYNVHYVCECQMAYSRELHEHTGHSSGEVKLSDVVTSWVGLSVTLVWTWDRRFVVSIFSTTLTCLPSKLFYICLPILLRVVDLELRATSWDFHLFAPIIVTLCEN